MEDILIKGGRLIREKKIRTLENNLKTLEVLSTIQILKLSLIPTTH